jgi:hypothetical protein
MKNDFHLLVLAVLVLPLVFGTLFHIHLLLLSILFTFSSFNADVLSWYTFGQLIFSHSVHSFMRLSF